MIRCVAVFLSVCLWSSLCGAEVSVSSSPPSRMTIQKCMRYARSRDLKVVADRAGEAYGFTKPTTRALVWVESRWRQEALSDKGARGLGQVMPATVAHKLGHAKPTPGKLEPTEQFAARLSVWKVFIGKIDERLRREPNYNLCWSARILSDALSVCGGDLRAALGAYWAGEYTCTYSNMVLDRVEQEQQDDPPPKEVGLNP